MLPFAIMNNYGNIAPVPETIQDYVHGTNFLAVLSSQGKLYMAGAFNTTMGLSSNAPTLVRSDVKNIWGNRNTLTIQTVLDRFYYIGYSSYSSAETGGTNYSSWQDVTSLYSALNLSLIKQVRMNGLDTHVVYTDGSLYAIGKNYNGNWGRGNTVGSSTFVLLRSDVLSIGGGETDYWGGTMSTIITKDNSLRTCGSIKANGSSENVTSWQLIDTSVLQSSVALTSYSSGAIRYKKASGWVQYGALSASITGNGSASFGYPGESTNVTYNPVPDSISDFYGSMNAAQFSLNDNNIYVTCSATGNSNGQAGLGIKYAGKDTFTLIDGLPAIKKVSSFDTYSVALSQSGQLYVCGASSKWGGTEGDVLVFSPLNIKS